MIISIFAGRAADTGKDPVPEFKKSIALSKKFKNVEILWASVREPYNYIQAKQLGCHIITVPPSIIEKIESYGKTFPQLTKETVKAFLIDSQKSKFIRYHDWEGVKGGFSLNYETGFSITQSSNILRMASSE